MAAAICDQHTGVSNEINVMDKEKIVQKWATFSNNINMFMKSSRWDSVIYQFFTLSKCKISSVL